MRDRPPALLFPPPALRGRVRVGVVAPRVWVASPPPAGFAATSPAKPGEVEIPAIQHGDPNPRRPAMHVLFVHQNFPAQFGPFAFRLARTPGYRCTFVSQKMDGTFRGVRCLKYDTRGGATEKTH